MATSHLNLDPEETAKAHFSDIHTVSAERNSDMAYTSASTALYHAESDHAKHSEPASDATHMAVVRQPLLPPGHIQRIKDMDTEHSSMTARAMKTPDIILTTLT